MQGARDSTNQRRVSVDQSEPSSQNASAVQKGRRFVSERGVERNENTSISSGVTDTNAISPRCNQGTFDGGATYHSANQNRPPDTRQRHDLRAHRRVRVLWRWVIGCKGLQIRPISAKELEIQPIRAVLPACNARHSIKGTAPTFLRISFSDRYQQHVNL